MLAWIAETRFAATPKPFNTCVNRLAATMGPMVWEEEGPTPILKMSVTLRKGAEGVGDVEGGMAGAQGVEATLTGLLAAAALATEARRGLETTEAAVMVRLIAAGLPAASARSACGCCACR